MSAADERSSDERDSDERGSAAMSAPDEGANADASAARSEPSAARSEPVIRCPECRGECPPRGQGSSYPFCSQRCQLLDLGRWLDEGYAVPDDDPFGGAFDGDDEPM